MKFEKICVVGLGYIGLPTATVIASRKRHVVGLDVDQATIDAINRGEAHIVEPGLDTLLPEAVAGGFLRATKAPEAADAFLIAVPTPFKGRHEPDLGYVKAASEAIAPVLKKGDLVILESTSPVGTTKAVAEWIAAARPDLALPVGGVDAPDVHVAYCPERVLPGKTVQELVSNDRVIGGLTPTCSEAAKALYAIFVEGECLLTDAATAEMCKLTENSFRDTNIAFANELSIVCDRLGIDVWELIALANHHPRVNILQPGPGVGGHCIAVDPWFIISAAPDAVKLIRQARLVNDGKPHWVVDRVREAIDDVRFIKGSHDTVSVACFGLSFKPDIDDLRESPAIDICQMLTGERATRIIAVEPHIDALPVRLADKAVLMDAEAALAEADIIVFLVNHQAFHALPLGALIGKHVVDASGLRRTLKAS